MKKNNRKIHKWLGLFSCVFIFIVSVSAVGLNHRNLIEKHFYHSDSKIFSVSNIKAMGTDPFDSNHLIASDYKKLYHSFDRGKSWSELKLFVPSENVNNIVFDPFTKDKILISIKNAGIYFSDDKGDIWDELPLPFTAEQGEYIELINISKNIINIKTRFGFYTYDSLNEKWNNILFNISNKEKLLDIEEIIFNIHTGKIFGNYGIFIYDIFATFLILLSFTGIFITFKPKNQNKIFKENLNGNIKNERDFSIK